MQPARPSTAVVLAAGLGTRMRPLSEVVPKPMMPLWGKPAIGHILDLLTRWDVGKVIINLHHRPAPIREYVDAEYADRLQITYSHEASILGTGGALRPVAGLLGDSPFWMINADIAADARPEPFLEAYADSDAVAVLWLDDARGPRTVEMKGNAITCFRSRTPRAAGTCTFCGLQLLSTRVLDYLPAGRAAGSIVEAYEAAISEGETVRGVCPADTFWADLGTPATYLAAHRDVRERHARGESGAVLFGSASGIRADAANMIYPAWAEQEERLAAVLDAMGWDRDQTLVNPLGARGSSRTFTRICRGAETAIVMRYDPERAENCRFAGHARFLAGIGLRVPAVLIDRPDACWTVVEDLGATSLADSCRGASAGACAGVYERVLDGVLLLHGEGTRAARRAGLETEPAFPGGAYEYERDLFASFYLGRLLGLPDAEIRAVVAELEDVADRLSRAPLVLLHRDLQSSNILIVEGSPAFIDFQGMRMGPAVYDLASLLCDPYMSLPMATRDRLLRYYAQRSEGDAGQVEDLFWWGGVQRLCQALGAYARLGIEAGLGEFEQFIPPALDMLARSLERIDGCGRLREAVAWRAFTCRE